MLFTHQWPIQRRLIHPAAAVRVLHIKHLGCWGESSSYFPSGHKSLTLPRAKHHSVLSWLECMIMSCMFLNQSLKKMFSCLLLASMYFSRDSLLMNLFPCSSSSLAAYLYHFPHQSQRVVMFDISPSLHQSPNRALIRPRSAVTCVTFITLV